MKTLTGFICDVIDRSYCVKRYDGSESEVAVPSYIDFTPVTQVGREAFYHNADVKVIQVPEGITAIGELAFANCPSLIRVELPDTLTKLAINAFWGDRGVTIMHKNHRYSSDNIYELIDKLGFSYTLMDLETDASTLMKVMERHPTDYQQWFKETFPKGAASARDVLDACSAVLTYTDTNVEEFIRQLTELAAFLLQTSEHEKWFRATFPNGAPSVQEALLQLIGQYKF